MADGGFVYFVRDTGTGLVKIGFSENPWLRLCKMQADCPSRLELVGLMEGDRQLESAIHRECARQRVRGEWFRCEGAVAERLACSEPAIRSPRSRRDDPRLALMADLCRATGRPANAVRGWIERGRVPAGYMLCVSEAGVISLDNLCQAAERNSRRFRTRGAPLNVRLEDLATGEAA
jgi:hypothetical protein